MPLSPLRATAPKSAKAYLQAVKEKDIDGMLDCFAPARRKSFQETMKRAGKEAAMSAYALTVKPDKFEILDTKTKGDCAEVETSLTMGARRARFRFQAHNIDGKWLIDTPEYEDARRKLLEESIR
jgi:hypothetical protein